MSSIKRSPLLEVPPHNPVLIWCFFGAGRRVVSRVGPNPHAPGNAQSSNITRPALAGLRARSAHPEVTAPVRAAFHMGFNVPERRIARPAGPTIVILES